MSRRARRVARAAAWAQGGCAPPACRRWTMPTRVPSVRAAPPCRTPARYVRSSVSPSLKSRRPAASSLTRTLRASACRFSFFMPSSGEKAQQRSIDGDFTRWLMLERLRWRQIACTVMEHGVPGPRIGVAVPARDPGAKRAPCRACQLSRRRQQTAGDRRARARSAADRRGMARSRCRRSRRHPPGRASATMPSRRQATHRSPAAAAAGPAGRPARVRGRRRLDGLAVDPGRSPGRSCGPACFAATSASSRHRAVGARRRPRPMISPTCRHDVEADHVGQFDRAHRHAEVARRPRRSTASGTPSPAACMRLEQVGHQHAVDEEARARCGRAAAACRCARVKARRPRASGPGRVAHWMTSTSGICATGLKKCRPTRRPGSASFAASVSSTMLEVLVASSAPGSGAARAARTARAWPPGSRRSPRSRTSASRHAVAGDVGLQPRRRLAARCRGSRLRLLEQRARALERGLRRTSARGPAASPSRPRSAHQAAMSPPMTPAPTTCTCCSGASGPCRPAP